MASKAVKVLGAAVGAVLSVVLVLSAFYRWDFTGAGPLLTSRFSLLTFIRQIPHHLGWMIPFILLTAAMVPLRAVQWGATLPAKVPFRERYHLVAIGGFVHNAIPGKLGDLTRAFLMARSQKSYFVVVLGSVAVCKLLEFAALMSLVALSLLGPFGKTMPQFLGALRAAVTGCIVLVIVVVLLAHYSGPLSERLVKAGRLPRWARFLAHVSDGLGAARSFRGMVLALLLSAGPVLASSLAYGLALTGVGVEGGIFAGAVMLGAISLGQGTPGVPAGTGIYYFVTSWAARKLGARPEDAAAFAALTHLCTVATFIGVGAISLWVRKIRLKDLRRGSLRAADAFKHAEHADALHGEPVRG
jgi:glycosyltransferase 2 family protein